MKKITLWAFLITATSLLFFSQSNAQSLSQEEKNEFKNLEYKLLNLADSMYRAPMPEDRVNYCFEFGKKLNEVLKIENSFYYPFDSLNKKIHILYPENKSFRIINWLVVPEANVGVQYFGCVQMASSEYKIFPLIAPNQNITLDNEHKILNNKTWLGAEIYKIKTVEDAGQKHYFVFGLNKSDQSSNFKFMEEYVFMDNDLQLGSNVYNIPATLVNAGNLPPARFILEYKKNTQVGLNYDEEKKMVVFDRLQSSANTPNRRATYVASGVIDGLTWKEGAWNYVPELIKPLKLSDGQAPINGVMK